MESSTSQKVAIVTGSSTGIGYETSLALARDGFITYATRSIRYRCPYQILCHL
jgi:NAD(P)-dependent dehydrogenase (short-subunit alcohol dehydrogenase family)